MIHVFKVIDSGCSTGGGPMDFIPLASHWDFSNTSGGTPYSQNTGNTTGGGSTAGGATTDINIFSPNYFENGDLNDPAVQNMLQINQFITTLYNSSNEIKGVIDYTEWLLAYTNYWIGSNGGLSTKNQLALTYAFNNIPTLFNQYNGNSYEPIEINNFKFSAFQFLLFHGEFLSNLDPTTQKSILESITSFEQIELTNNVVNFMIKNPGATWVALMNNKTSLDTSTGDLDNNTSDGFDTRTYSDFNTQQNWTNITSIIPTNKYVGWNRSAHPTWQRMEYSKEQLRVMGYKISNYRATGQTFQIYTAQNGVNNTGLTKGLSYLKYALTNNIPVIVGVDNHSGSPNPDTDNTTDHFIVIIGMGQDSNGKYFQFYDNASGDPSQGANSSNKLYYNSTTGIISGSSMTNYAIDNGLNPYKITMIRKSKPL
jgi:hypothetical protein